MSTFKEFLKQKFNETRFGILLKKSLEQNTIDTEWGDTIVYDPLNEKRVYEIGKKYEENFSPNGLKTLRLKNQLITISTKVFLTNVVQAAQKIRGIVCQTPQAGNRHSVKTGGEYRCNRNRKSTPLFDV